MAQAQVRSNSQLLQSLSVSLGAATPEEIRIVRNEVDVTLEVRAFYRSPNKDDVKPLPTAGNSRTGEAVELLMIVQVPKPADGSRGAEIQVVIPYAALSLPTGGIYLLMVLENGLGNYVP